MLFDAIDREAKELPPYSIFIITRRRDMAVKKFMSGDIVTSPICIVPHSRAWHQASHSLTFCGFVWLGGAEPFTSQFIFGVFLVYFDAPLHTKTTPIRSQTLGGEFVG